MGVKGHFHIKIRQGIKASCLATVMIWSVTKGEGRCMS